MKRFPVWQFVAGGKKKDLYPGMRNALDKDLADELNRLQPGLFTGLTGLEPAWSMAGSYSSL